MKANPLMAMSGWEAFMHGVFAIAVTLLVLDIRVPDAATIHSGSALIERPRRRDAALCRLRRSASSSWARTGSQTHQGR